MQIFGFPVRALIVVVIGASAALLANMLGLIIVGQLNQKLPIDRPISYFWYDLRIRKQHHQLYPNSKLILLLNLCIIVIIVSVVLFILFMKLG